MAPYLSPPARSTLTPPRSTLDPARGDWAHWERAVHKDISASGEAREERGGDDLIAGTQDVLQHRLSQTRDASNLIAFQAVRLLN